MRFLVVAVGARQPDWVEAGFDDYARRMPREARIELMRIKPESRSTGKTVDQMLAREAERMAAALPRDCERVVLDERGKLCDTLQLSRHIERWLGSGRDTAFVIGGADGTAPVLKREASMLLSLSALTLPHGLARVLLAEQLYRGLSILRNHPYHRE
jgi:23S rRNA (pseudouridine1915-N3)-methyltransferase